MNSYDSIAEYNAGIFDSPEVKHQSFPSAAVYAMRDIEAGEEIVTGYDEFDTHDYTPFGL